MDNYKGITFAKGYNKSFAEFKEEFASIHIFKNIHPKEREAELKKAYNIAIKNNGNVKTTTSKSAKSNEPKHK